MLNRPIIFAAFLSTVATLSLAPSYAQTELTAPGGPPVLTPPPSSLSILTLAVGESRILRFPVVSRAAIGNPTVADIAILSRSEVLLNAKAAGETLLYVGNKQGSASIQVRVRGVAQTMDDTAAKINQALGGTGVTAQVAGDSIFLRGRVESKEAEDQAIAVAKAYTPKVQSFVTIAKSEDALVSTLTAAMKTLGVNLRSAGNVIILEGSCTKENLDRVKALVQNLGEGYKVVNLVTDNAVPHQVIIHAKIVDIDQGAIRQLGLDWGALLYNDDGKLTGVGQPVVIGENRAGEIGLDNGGPLNRLDRIGATIQALEKGNRAKILSSPDVLVAENRKAEILVGGEIPVPVPQGGGNNVIVIEYHTYGVKLNVTPRLLDTDTVLMKVAPEVSTPDYTNAVMLSGFQIPAFKVRRADTEVSVRNGQTLVIGGLLQDEDIDALRKIPLLGDIPILGELFKFRSTSRTRTQLVILVTPEILTPGAMVPVPAVAEMKADPIPMGTVTGTPPSSTAPPAVPGLPPVPPTAIPSPAVG